LTLTASSLYRLLAGRIGQGYEHTELRHLFQDFVAAGFDRTDTVIPWLGDRQLQLVFG
jgi:hypothetical protein